MSMMRIKTIQHLKMLTCDLWLSKEFPKIKVFAVADDSYMKNVSIEKKSGKG